MSDSLGNSFFWGKKLTFIFTAVGHDDRTRFAVQFCAHPFPRPDPRSTLISVANRRPRCRLRESGRRAGLLPAKHRPRRQVSVGTARHAGPQPNGDLILLGLLPFQRHLLRHHMLPLHDQLTFFAHAILVTAMAFVPLQPGHHAVVATARAFRPARALLRGRVGQKITARARRGHVAGQMRRMVVVVTACDERKVCRQHFSPFFSFPPPSSGRLDETNNAEKFGLKNDGCRTTINDKHTGQQQQMPSSGWRLNSVINFKGSGLCRSIIHEKLTHLKRTVDVSVWRIPVKQFDGRAL